MKGFSHFVLVSTLDLAEETMLHDHRVAGYVWEIRHFLHNLLRHSAPKSRRHWLA